MPAPRRAPPPVRGGEALLLEFVDRGVDASALGRCVQLGERVDGLEADERLSDGLVAIGLRHDARCERNAMSVRGDRLALGLAQSVDAQLLVVGRRLVESVRRAVA
eukprot:7334779-Prymnesium_polylepis.1